MFGRVDGMFFGLSAKPELEHKGELKPITFFTPISLLQLKLSQMKVKKPLHTKKNQEILILETKGIYEKCLKYNRDNNKSKYKK